MGRNFLQVLWINFAMFVGTCSGIKIADAFMWNEDIKYLIWENTENEFWDENGKPTNLDALVKFDSVKNPGSVFYSYLPPFKNYIENDYYEKYKI